MAKKTLDVGMIEKAERYYTDRPYIDGTMRYAARSNWFIRFWGYVFHKLPENLVPNIAENSALLFVGTDNKLKLKLGATVQDVNEMKLTEIDSGLLSGNIDMAERVDDLDMQNLNIDISINSWDS